MKKIKDEKFYLGKRGFIVQKMNHKEEELQNISFNAYKSVELYDEKLYLHRQLEGIISCID